ncbi:MAG: fumarylacetoacetate hydrolase family protein, partial [Actinomycetes bacterium]
VNIEKIPPIGVSFPLATATLMSPVQSPGKIIAVGLNYADHALEANFDIPPAPMIFAKFVSSIIGHGQPIQFRNADSAEVDYESELAVIIGQRTRNISTDRALDSVYGYTLCNDVSARDAQFSDKQFTRGKSFDTFCPVGPFILTADEIDDPQNLPIKARLNGITVQDSSTSEMIFSIAEIISYISRFITLEPGDLISTGTPAGVGMAKKPPIYLRDGDVIEVEVVGVGVLSNPIEVN